MLRQLEKSGLIHRESNIGDKRSVKIYLTELGKEKRHQARVIGKLFNNYLNEHMSENEREQLIKMLKKVNQLTLNFKPER
jgi:DNA-binding MarR family transcriptional regulator